MLEEHLAVNLFGPHALIQALLPRLTDPGGAVVNVLSVAALASLPIIPAYSISKAAAFSWSQSLRPCWLAVARAIFEAVDRGEDEIFPDPCPRSWHPAGAPAR